MTATEPATRDPDQTERTEHPHVVKTPGVLGGEPRIDGTRMPVLQLFELVEHGIAVAEIIADFPYLSPAHIHDAVSYAHDHPAEMAYYANEHRLRTAMQKNDMVYVEGRLIVRSRLRPADVPPGATVYTWETLPKQPGE